MPAAIWFGQPSPPAEYCHTAVYFQKAATFLRDA